MTTDLRSARDEHLHEHIESIYDELTDGLRLNLRVSDLVYAAAERYPGLVPTRDAIEAERELPQKQKAGLEIDQGVFVAHVLAKPRIGFHLMHAMSQPRAEALTYLETFRRKGHVDLGTMLVERDGAIGRVTIQNHAFLNSEDDVSTSAFETAVDLVLMDDQIEVGVVRGAPATHPKYEGRRIFGSGINLTHLYYGKISLVEFMIERELGGVSKMYRGHSVGDFDSTDLEQRREKPWIAAVETFAIGGGCQLLCVVDRVLAEPGSYFNLPASKEGFIPGAANLRLPRLVGIKLAREGIFFERAFEAESPEGRMICDAVVPAAEMDAAIERDALQLVQAGMTSTVANRKALRIAQEPLSIYRRYMATYARQQALCLYDPRLIHNLEHNWQPGRRHM